MFAAAVLHAIYCWIWVRRCSIHILSLGLSLSCPCWFSLMTSHAVHQKDAHILSSGQSSVAIFPSLQKPPLLLNACCIRTITPMYLWAYMCYYVCLLIKNNTLNTHQKFRRSCKRRRRRGWNSRQGDEVTKAVQVQNQLHEKLDLFSKKKRFMMNGCICTKSLWFFS